MALSRIKKEELRRGQREKQKREVQILKKGRLGFQSTPKTLNALSLPSVL